MAKKSSGGGFLNSFLSGPAGGLPSITGGDARSSASSTSVNRGVFNYNGDFTTGGSGAGVNTGSTSNINMLVFGAIILGAIYLWKKM